ncbi:hypothetical protein ACFOPX_05565 [Helicobacter baculiformis]|uniref:Periplasmic protein n=1 Tax=Helicobacter baculiformis TaxID=427351 RepID=A0ABV7ZIN6_9HELI|nr:hypothetical protein [Helicobacter baculiformis]
MRWVVIFLLCLRIACAFSFEEEVFWLGDDRSNAHVQAIYPEWFCDRYKSKDQALHDQVICDVSDVGMTEFSNIALTMLHRFYVDYYQYVRARVSPEDRQKVRQISLKYIYKEGKECSATMHEQYSLAEKEGTNPHTMPLFEEIRCMEENYTSAFQEITRLLLNNPTYAPVFAQFFYPNASKYRKLIFVDKDKEALANRDPTDNGYMDTFMGQAAQDNLIDQRGRWLKPELKKAHDQVQQWLATYLKGKHTKKFTANMQTMTHHQETYTFIFASFKETLYGGSHHYTCMGILHAKHLERGFCTDRKGLDVGRQLTTKGAFFTLRLSDFLKPHNDRAYRDYFTFKLADHRFYLHEYSREVLTCRGSCHDLDYDTLVLRTQIFYRQSRDDPQNQHPISLQTFFESLNNGNFENLIHPI